MAESRFVFRLEVLLEHRRQLERDRQLKVAQIQQQINTLVTQVRDAEAQIMKENRALTAEQLLGRLDLTYIAHEKRFVGSLQMVIAVAFQRLVVVEKAMAGARAELLEAARARKVMEKLKERQHQRWREEQNRKDAAALDEIGTQLALRKVREDQERSATAGI